MTSPWIWKRCWSVIALAIFLSGHTNVESASSCDLLDLVFVIDSSGSINKLDPNNWGRVLTFINKIIDSFTVGENNVHVGMVEYSYTARVEWKLDAYYTNREVTDAVSRLPFDDSRTNTAHALELTRTDVFSRSGDRSGVPNVAILITDGIPNERINDTVPQATRAKNEQIEIFVIGVTNNTDKEMLRNIASNPDEVMQVDDFNKLDTVLHLITGKTCVTEGMVKPA